MPSNSDIDKLRENIPAKQVTFVSDSCHSGALVGGYRVCANVGRRKSSSNAQSR